MKLEFTQQIFEKYSYIKFYKNPSCGSRDVSFAWTDVQTDMTKLIVAFSKFCETRLKGENRIISYAKGGVRNSLRHPFLNVSRWVKRLQSVPTADKI